LALQITRTLTDLKHYEKEYEKKKKFPWAISNSPLGYFMELPWG
jgi:hypothetical protein